ncbi:MAG: sulfurtransferase TusA family protein [Thermodesulfobacteriota bacterium]
MNANKTLDVIGQSCPMPLLKTKKQLKNMEEGETLKVLATDPSYYGDIDKFCKSGMAEIVKYQIFDGVFIFYMKKIKK